jgi:hypothetical protein
VWRSLVARLNGVQEAGGSSPFTQTTFYLKTRCISGFIDIFGLYFYVDFKENIIKVAGFFI